MNYQEVDIGTRVGFVCGLIGLLMIITLGGCNPKPAPATKNRVPTLQENAEQAQQAADSAAASAKQAQDALTKLQQSQTPHERQPGDPEHTGLGRVTDVTEVWEPKEQTTWGDAYTAFTFLEDSGFQKRFYPVCSDQVIQTGKTLAILYHWKVSHNGSHNDHGCFLIDGYQYPVKP
jgi:hypothetical protein